MRELESGALGIAFTCNEFFKIISGTEATFAGTHDNADILGVIVSHLEIRILQGAHTRHRLELSQVVELTVESHLDAEFLVVVECNRRMHRGRFRLLVGLYRFEVGSLAVTKRRDDSETRHGNLLRLGGLGGNFAGHLREDNRRIRSAERHVVAQHALEFLMTGMVLYEVETSHLFLEGGGLFVAVGERREHRIGRQGLDAEDGLDCTGGTEAVAGHHLGRAHADIRIVFAKEILERRNFGIVVLTRTRTVSIHVADIGLVDAGILDGAVNRFHQADAIFTRSGNVVCVARNARTEHFAVLFCRAFLGMFVRFDNDDSRTFAKRNAVATVERRASVFVEGMERKEAGIRNSRKGVGTARNHHVGLTRTNQVAGNRNRNRTCRTGVRHVRHDTASAARFSNLRSNGGNRHLCNFRSVAAMLMILFNGKHAAHAATDHHAHALVVTKIRKPRIG